MQRVSVVRCEDYDEKRLTEKIISALSYLGGIEQFIKRGDRVLLKPNLLKGKPHTTCITTHPVFTQVCAKIVKDFGGRPVVGDSPPIFSCQKAARDSGLTDELKKIGVELIEFETPVRLVTNEYSVFKDIYVAKEALDVDCVINLPKVKSHVQMILTACVKNIFGVVIGKQKSMWHLKAGISNDHFARMLIELYLGISPALTIADMIMVMEGNGPGSGTPREVGAIVCGSDCLSMDAVICKILGIPQDTVYIQRVAGSIGYLESTELSNIEIAGEALDEIIKSAAGFKVPTVKEADFGLPPFIKNIFRDSLSSKPVIDEKLCTYCKACEKICPTNMISVSEGDIKFDYDKCIKCFCCQEICSCGALQVKQGALLKIAEYFK